MSLALHILLLCAPLFFRWADVGLQRELALFFLPFMGRLSMQQEGRLRGARVHRFRSAGPCLASVARGGFGSFL